MKVYLPYSVNYILFQNVGGIDGWTVHGPNGGKDPVRLEPHELIAVGQTIEIHRQLQHGFLEEVNEHVLCSKVGCSHGKA